MTQTGKTPQRGFGGRVMFYGKDGNDPILVDGQFVVYAFDETNREPTDNKPTRRYVFPPDQVAIRMSKSELGAGYSFWLPWDEVGGPQTNISLICRFEPKKGARGCRRANSALAARRACGRLRCSPPATFRRSCPRERRCDRRFGRCRTRRRPRRAATPDSLPIANNQVQAAIYQTDRSRRMMPRSLEQAQRRMTTTSITLPESFQRRTGPGRRVQSSGASNSAADHLQALAAQLPGQNRTPAPVAAMQVAMAQPTAAPQQLQRPPVTAVQPPAATPPTNRFAQPGASLPTAFQAFSPSEMSTMQPPNNNFTPAASGPQAMAGRQAAPTSGPNAHNLSQPGALPVNQMGRSCRRRRE